ncbi:early nodulin-16-like [Pistacia vera]|uniref:early nodulin-16-like n=1 Tax=Pistacia vera TaxID=55513 RepID=UPI00126382CF|nr:early nodulin-16-like [Pistacia vera]
MALLRQLLVPIAMVMAIFCGGCSSLQYLVGDSIWSTPPYPKYYSEWSSSHLFYTGDSVVFGFETDVYNLIQVLISDYENCTANNAVYVLNE